MLKRKRPRPRFNASDRLFWAALRRFWPRWSAVLLIVKPETVIGWRRAGFRSTGAPEPRGGRPQLPRNRENQLGGAPSGLTVAGFLEAIDATHILDRPLVNATGIQGYYDIELSAPADVPQNRPDPSELIKALEKQLGLKVALKTLSLRMLVIDHMERIPTGN